MCEHHVLSGKIAIVTGGSSGIGAAIAAKFQEEGATVAILDLQKPEAGGGMFVLGDVSSETDVQQAIARVVRECGGIDILVNNAGTEIACELSRMSSEQWERQLAVNLKGAFLMTKHAAPFLRRGGAVINISSIDALASYPGLAAYDASKAGLLAFTRASALELGPYGVRVNAICPGYIETPLLDAYFERQENPHKSRAEVISQHSLGRMGKAEEVGSCALFLASPSAAFVHGTYLVVDGGLIAAGR